MDDMFAACRPRVLATGFQPFNQDKMNPSWMAVSALPQKIAGVSIVREQLPVEWFTALERLEQKICQVQPDILLLVGLAGGRDSISLERVGINLCEARIADNAGTTLFNTPIYPEGPAAYFSTLPFERMKAALDEAGIPNKYSFTAGAFLCNHVLYGSLHLAATRYPQLRALFVHVPGIPEMGRTDIPVMPLSTIVRALEICLEASIEDWKEKH